MIKSMTGFGQARGLIGALQCTVELRSWNHRFFECSSRFPAILLGLEDKVRDLLRSRFTRGKIAVSITLRSASTESELVLDEAKIKLYLQAIRKTQKKYKLKGEIDLNSLFSLPNLFTVTAKEELSESEWRALSRILEQAASKLSQAKEKEGVALARDLKKRIEAINKDIKSIEVQSAGLTQRILERISAKVSELAKNVGIEPQRVEQEAVMLAERSDITEELVRVAHHVETFRKALDESEETGKKLDFIAQEIHREVNTIASKAQDALIADSVIRIKTELEKIREQVQNVE